jgi:hypothetical protein
MRFDQMAGSAAWKSSAAQSRSATYGRCFVGPDGSAAMVVVEPEGGSGVSSVRG